MVHIYIGTGTRAPKVRVGYYAYVLECNGVTREGTGCSTDTTYYRLVMSAIIEALERMRRPSKIEILTDCKYLVYSHRNMPIWTANGWKRYDGKPLANADLWEALNKAGEGHEITYSFATSHVYSEALKYGLEKAARHSKS